jgi:BRCT domain type II-containing protein
MKLVSSIVRRAGGKGFLFSAVFAAAVAGSAASAHAGTATNLNNPGISVPEINSSGLAGLAIVLLGTVALIAESKSKPACKS